MNTLETVQTTHLTKTTDGTIRVGATRVSLESIVHHFSLGATAEEISQKFPVLKLAQIYGVISYFLENHEAVAEYVLRQEAESDQLQQELEPKFQAATNDLRRRILARWQERQSALIQ